MSSADELPEAGGRTCKRRVAKVFNPRFHRGIGKNGIDLLVELLDDIGGVFFGAPIPSHVLGRSRDRRLQVWVR